MFGGTIGVCTQPRAAPRLGAGQFQGCTPPRLQASRCYHQRYHWRSSHRSGVRNIVL